MIRSPLRDDDGATSAEYAGVVAFVALLAVALIAFVTPVGGQVKALADNAICHIASAAGLSGCTPPAVRNFEPPDCMASSEAASAGGSVTLLVTVGGDDDYDLQRVQRRDKDGLWHTSYLLTTKRSGKIAYKPGEGGGIKRGDGEVGEGGNVSIEVNGSKGTTYEFPTEDEARKGVDAWKSQNDANFFVTHDIGGKHVADIYTGGVKASIKGKGPNGNTAEASIGEVLGVTVNQVTHETSVSLTTSVAAAVKLGIPMPEGLEAKEGADAQADVALTATWDDKGNLVAISGLFVGSLQGNSSIGADSTVPKGTTVGKVGIEKVKLPTLQDAGGAQVRVQFSTDFRRPDGSVDNSAVGVFADAVTRFVTQGQMPTPEQAAALHQQINEHSTLTADTYLYSSTKPEFGFEGRWGPLAVGAEVHTSATDRQLISGKFYDFDKGEWENRVGCANG